MAKLSLAIYSALVLGGAVAGCTDPAPAQGGAQAVGTSLETAAESGALQSATPDDNPGQAQIRDGVVHRPVAVKHVVDPVQGAQLVAPSGAQPAAASPASSLQGPGMAHRIAP